MVEKSVTKCNLCVCMDYKTLTAVVHINETVLADCCITLDKNAFAVRFRHGRVHTFNSSKVKNCWVPKQQPVELWCAQTHQTREPPLHHLVMTQTRAALTGPQSRKLTIKMRTEHNLSFYYTYHRQNFHEIDNKSYGHTFNSQVYCDGVQLTLYLL